MELVRYAALGLVQGLTEFLPVSSSGHLVLAQRYLGVEAPGIVLEVTLHVATALAIVIYFRRRLVTMFAASAGGKRAVTDEIGLVRFPLDRAGSWMLKVSLVAPCDDCRVSKTETLRSTLVLSSGG